MSEASAEDLLALASEDLAVARLVQAEGLSGVALGFHAQQAVEKALKAALANRRVAYPHSHDLTRLFELCEAHGFEIPPELDQTDRLTPYAAAGRYGAADLPKVDPADAIAWAEAALKWAEATIAD